MAIDLNIVDDHHVKLTGVIDEYCTDAFSQLLQFVKNDVILDLENVQGINSCGVLALYRFVKDLQDQGKVIKYAHCPTPIAQQFTYVPQLVKESEVLSVYLGTQCTACESAGRVLLTADNLKSVEQEFLDEKHTCSECGASMDPDDEIQLFSEFFGDTPHNGAA